MNNLCEVRLDFMCANLVYKKNGDCKHCRRKTKRTKLGNIFSECRYKNSAGFCTNPKAINEQMKKLGWVPKDADK